MGVLAGYVVLVIIVCKLPKVRDHRKLTVGLIVLAVCIALVLAMPYKMRFIEYVKSRMQASQLFETEYVDPKETAITFPEKKRNLIYIYLESMENTFFSKEQGGVKDVCVIPELYDLAVENLNFSQNEGIGGGREISGATWTMGAMVAHSSGIPLKLPSGVDYNNYGYYSHVLPGVTTLYDILHENGYQQTFVCGSGAQFGGRDKYLLQHGVDTVYDWWYASSTGVVAPDYFVWWGMEDSYTYQMAKDKLDELSQTGEPFAMTLLTVDTHFPDGYVCDLCFDDYDDQYDNVYACASYQLYDFLDWLSWQDYYEDTTIIITGDHLSMDGEYIRRNNAESYDRRMYNCFINSAVTPVNAKNREFTTFDMFPTTLAAMGCTIEGDRLALGVNLFSDVPTLTESMGFETFNELVSQQSRMYEDEFRNVIVRE